MIRDDIIDEIRAARDEIARKYGYNVDAIFEAFRTAEAVSGKPHLTFEPHKTAQQPLPASPAPPCR